MSCCSSRDGLARPAPLPEPTPKRFGATPRPSAPTSANSRSLSSATAVGLPSIPVAMHGGWRPANATQDGLKMTLLGAMYEPTKPEKRSCGQCAAGPYRCNQQVVWRRPNPQHDCNARASNILRDAVTTCDFAYRCWPRQSVEQIRPPQHEARVPASETWGIQWAINGLELTVPHAKEGVHGTVRRQDASGFLNTGHLCAQWTSMRLLGCEATPHITHGRKPIMLQCMQARFGRAWRLPNRRNAAQHMSQASMRTIRHRMAISKWRDLWSFTSPSQQLVCCCPCRCIWPQTACGRKVGSVVPGQGVRSTRPRSKRDGRGGGQEARLPLSKPYSSTPSIALASLFSFT